MATSVFEAVNPWFEGTKQYISGFRVPDWKKLWYGEDQIDSSSPPAKSMLVQFEAYLVKLQELSLWTDPQSSVAALVVLHLIYWYLTVTQNSPVYLLATLSMVWFVYSTWTQRIWPAIRVPEADPGPSPDWTPVNPDVLSAPEIIKLWDDVKSQLISISSWLWELRRSEPGKFCALMSSVFLVMAYVGSCITTLGLFYYVFVGYLTIPGVLKILVKYPAVQCILETMEEFKNKPETTVRPEIELTTRRDDHHDETDAAGPAVPPSLVGSVYATLQSGLNAVSNLNLKSEIASLKAEKDDLSPYLPDEEDEVNQSILESAISSSTRDPMQAHNLDQEEVADSSLEYASLLPVSGNLMPDDDEEDMDELDTASNTLPALTLKVSDDDDEDEFLPSAKAAKQPQSDSEKLTNLEKHENVTDEEEEDEFAASLMAVAAKENIAEESVSPVIRRRKTSAAGAVTDDIMDDFEMISEEELAEVSP